MRFSCKWSYRPCKNMWFNKGSVSSFCGITVLLKLFLCNSIITMIDCISCSCPSHHFFSVRPENNYHFPLNPISNTLGLPWNKTPVSHPWHPLALFTLFLSFCLCDWMPDVCSPTKPSEPDLPTRLPPLCSSPLPLSVRNEFIRLGSLPLFPYWSFRCCFHLCLLPYTSTQPPLAGLCLLKTNSLWCITRQCRAEELWRAKASLPLFVSVLLQSLGIEELHLNRHYPQKGNLSHFLRHARAWMRPYIKQAVHDFQHYRGRLYQQVLIPSFYPGLILLLTRIQVDVCALKYTYHSMYRSNLGIWCTWGRCEMLFESHFPLTSSTSQCSKIRSMFALTPREFKWGRKRWCRLSGSILRSLEMGSSIGSQLSYCTAMWSKLL